MMNLNLSSGGMIRRGLKTLSRQNWVASNTLYDLEFNEERCRWQLATTVSSQGVGTYWLSDKK